MVIGIIGESCVGKSTIAHQLKEILNAEVYTGKDYLRLAKNENMARILFEKKLREVSKNKHVIYVISEMEHISLLPENAFRIVMTADLQTIKNRFAKRMHGHLPEPVANMLERKHGCFDALDCHVRIDGNTDVQTVIKEMINNL